MKWCVLLFTSELAGEGIRQLPTRRQRAIDGNVTHRRDPAINDGEISNQQRSFPGAGSIIYKGEAMPAHQITRIGTKHQLTMVVVSQGAPNLIAFLRIMR